MTGDAPPDAAIPDALDRLVRDDGGRLLSGLIAVLRDFQLAEDSLQDALEAALLHWRGHSLPANPAGWLMQTARRKAIDRIRRAASFRMKSDELAALIALDAGPADEVDPEAIPDERLRLIFTCCHPALDRRTSVALTLRSVCGLKTEEIARAFVVSSESMAQRLVRARHKIARAGIPYAVPGPEGWAERLEAVLTVVYLIFNEGYAAASETPLRVELCEEAIRLGRLLSRLSPAEPEIDGLLALMLLHHSRSPARIDAAGGIVPLDRQDRAAWNGPLIAEGVTLLQTTLRRGRPGPYQLQAAVSAIHAEAPSFAETNWREIVLVYDALMARNPNPVFVLNRIAALSYAQGPEAALAPLDGLAMILAPYQPYHAVRADILARLGRKAAARDAYDAAIRLSSSPAERRLLEERRQGLEGRSGDGWPG